METVIKFLISFTIGIVTTLSLYVLIVKFIIPLFYE